ncbi:MAG: hypothetical protein NVS9B14_16460 [Candidatus Acidiferrum sp.]
MSGRDGAEIESVHSFGKLAARAPESGFDGIGRDVQDFGRFPRRKFQNDAKDKHGTENRRKSFDLVPCQRQDLRAAEELFGSHCFGGETILDRGFRILEWFQRREGRAGQETSAAHEGGVYDNSREPSGELRAPFKFVETSKSAKQTVLQSIFRVFAIAGDSEGGMKKQFAMAMKERV